MFSTILGSGGSKNVDVSIFFFCKLIRCKLVGGGGNFSNKGTGGGKILDVLISSFFKLVSGRGGGVGREDVLRTSSNKEITLPIFS